MNVLFANYHDFTSNSAIHIFNLAEQLSRLGDTCSVAVPSDPESVSCIGSPTFAAIDFEDARHGRFGFPNGRAPDLIHAWTPREGVRRLTGDIAARHSIPYFVHLEDNEDVIAADQLGLGRASLLDTSERELKRRLTDTVSHPRRARAFLAGASGVTVITERLLEFVPPGVPSAVISPAFEEHLFVPQPPSPELRARLGIPDGDTVIVYAGNVHATNAAEVRSLYLAVALLNRQGLPVTLVRLGRDFVEFLTGGAAAAARHVKHVTFRPRHELPLYYALADVLVQPGRPDDFNDYRIPSKLPEFFAMGRPVVLPRTNIGNSARDEEECLHLDQGDALDIATKLERLIQDDELRRRLAVGARRFAESHFSWPKSAARLRAFYTTTVGPTTAPALRFAPDEAIERYRSLAPPPIGYATVRDYSDSVEFLPFLATLNHDLKDVQRPWALKAILGTVPIGARLLEIGAGDPYVADILARIGYDVTVVDPYDGRDRGPEAFEAIVAAYPHLRFIRGVFPDVVEDEEPYECVYSISVLEHLLEQDIPHVWAGIRRLSAPHATTVHAIDHVHLGAGDAEHLSRLRVIASEAGIERARLDEVLSDMDGDPDAYFLSAEAHNLWRGRQSYDEFPMRRCVSIQLCVPVQAKG
jgi:glycosyltransferase involved in cell wall biosynthesis